MEGKALTVLSDDKVVGFFLLEDLAKLAVLLTSSSHAIILFNTFLFPHYETRVYRSLGLTIRVNST